MSNLSELTLMQIAGGVVDLCSLRRSPFWPENILGATILMTEGEGTVSCFVNRAGWPDTDAGL